MERSFLKLALSSLFLFVITIGYQNCSDIRFSRVGGGLNASGGGALCESTDFNLSSTNGNTFPVQINTNTNLGLSVLSDDPGSQINSIIWTLPDGGQLSGNDIQVNFPSSGLKNMKVAVQSDGCDNPKERNFSVNVVGSSCSAVADAIIQASSGNPGSLGQVSNFEIDILSCFNVNSVVWNFGDGSNETLGTLANGKASASHTYLNPGLYIVSARINHRNNEEVEIRLPYVVQRDEQSIEELFISGPSMGYILNNYEFEVARKGSSNMLPLNPINWDMGDGNILTTTGLSVLHQYSNVGLKSIQANLEDSEQNQRVLKHEFNALNSISSCDFENASFYISGPRSASIQEQVNYDLSYLKRCWDVSNIQWEFEGSVTANSFHTFNSPGIYPVKALFNIVGVSGQQEVLVYVNVFDVCEADERIPYNSENLTCEACEAGHYLETTQNTCELCTNVPQDLNIQGGSVGVGSPGVSDSCPIICDDPSYEYNAATQACEPTTCDNGATNAPTCDLCPDGQAMIGEQCEIITFSWQTSDWSECSSDTCDVNGEQTRSAVCKSSTGETVEDINCALPKPAISQTCQPEAATCSCPSGEANIGGQCLQTSWDTGAWSDCSVDQCGQTGNQTREVVCKASNGDVLADSQCLEAKPSSSQSCQPEAATCSCPSRETNIAGQCYQTSWDTGAWSDCDTDLCGDTGNQTRSVVCKASTGDIVSDSECSTTKPASSQTCQPEAASCSCPSGETNIGGQCYALCGPGQYRKSSDDIKCTNVGRFHYSPNVNDDRYRCTENRNTSGLGLGADSRSDCLAGLDFYGKDTSKKATFVGNGYYSPYRNNDRNKCTNAPDNSVYTNSGGGVNNCPWQCDSNSQLMNGQCVPYYVDLHFTDNPSANTGSYLPTANLTTITETQETYSYIKLRYPNRSFELCHTIDGNKNCLSARFVQLSGNSFEIEGTNTGTGERVKMTRIYSSTQYEIFRGHNSGGHIGAAGQTITSSVQVGNQIDSVTYSVTP